MRILEISTDNLLKSEHDKSNDLGKLCGKIPLNSVRTRNFKKIEFSEEVIFMEQRKSKSIRVTGMELEEYDKIRNWGQLEERFQHG